MATAVTKLQGRRERAKLQARRDLMLQAKEKLKADIEAKRKEEEERRLAEQRAKEIIARRMAVLFRVRRVWKAKLKKEKEIEDAAVHIQSVFRGQKVRETIKELIVERPAEEEDSLEFLDSEVGSSCPSGSVRSIKSKKTHKIKQPAHTVEVSSEMEAFLETVKSIPPSWCPGAELPMPGIETLWEMLASSGRGQICTAFSAMDFLNLFAAGRTTGLEQLRFAITEKLIELDDVQCEDIYTRQVAAVIIFLKTHRDAQLDRSTLMEVAGDVFDPCGELHSDFSDLGVDNNTEFNLKVFKRTVAGIAMLLGIKESWLIAHLYWYNTKQFELAPDLGFKILIKTFHKIQVPLKFTQTDFYRLCYSWHVVDPKGRNGIRTSSLPTIFAKTLQRMPSLFQKRISLRPKLHGHRKLEVSDAQERHYIRGWTEFSILLQMLFNAMPMGVFCSPLEMCLEGISRSTSKPPAYVVSPRASARLDD